MKNGDAEVKKELVHLNLGRKCNSKQVKVELCKQFDCVDY